MQYHAPIKQFTVYTKDLEYAAMSLRLAIKNIRIIDGLLFTKHKRETALTSSDHAQKMITDAAKANDIDLGAEWGNQLGRISPTALQNATNVVQAFGCSMVQAAQSLQAFGDGAKALEAETEMLKRAAAAKRPWYRRGRW